ncbi:DUF2780 domain-containing protein [Thalassotalea aquiviva]|uniref:DUF2780 domain-containing protein n=1 Tax=Thalassotalea aquiviva TaxID=3242415 RepID=UPI00352A41B1
MKHLALMTFLLIFSFAPQAEESVISSSGMVDSLVNNLDISKSQASGGLGSLFQFAKGNLSTSDFASLTDAIPGLDGLLGAAPDVSSSLSSGGLGGLLGKASEYSDSMKGLANLKSQFDALGLDPAMIQSFASQALSYLNTDQGSQAKSLLEQGLGGLLGG